MAYSYVLLLLCTDFYFSLTLSWLAIPRLAAASLLATAKQTTTTSRTPSTGLRLNLCLKKLGISCEILKCSQNVLRQGDQASLSEELALIFAPPPSRELADTMVDPYCTSFESVYRIIHVSSFRSEYQRYWDNPESATASQCLKILLVISIGSSLRDHENATTSLRQKVQQWVHAAQAWLSGPLEKDRLDVSGLQVYCLVILARQIFSIGGDLVWVSMGSVIRMAMQIGLHHDPKHLPAMSLLQAELRRRLWATVLEMAIQSSLDSAMPPIISLNHFDTEAPSNYNDDEIDESAIELVAHPRSTYTTSSIQLILLDSIPTRLCILQLLSDLKAELSYQDALSLSSEVTDSYCAYRKFGQENINSGMAPFHRNLIDYFVRRFLIPLHCLFASKTQANPLL